MSDSHPAACENCSAPLHGPFCHRCGQAGHSPVRSFTHAVEEVFESFWHLDGRIFRTMRRLLVPGALARDYLAGHRAPYVAPMRLFVILCLLAFFVGKLTVHFGDDGRRNTVTPVDLISGDTVGAELARAGSVAEVEAIRDRTIASLEQTRQSLPATPAAIRRGIDGGIEAVNRQSDRRLVQLGGTAAPARPPEQAGPVPPDAEPAGWLQRQFEQIGRNAEQLQDDPERLKSAFLGAVPTMLFVFVPLFALLLKLFYVETGRLYLEHLVVALYSHAFLSLALLTRFLLLGLEHALVPRLAAAGTAIDLLVWLLWLWVPLYLLLMQKRVYAQRWWLTVPKFLLIGAVYATAMLLSVAGVLLVSLARL